MGLAATVRARLKAAAPPLIRDLIFALNAHHRVHGEYPRLLRPKTFNEMILRRKVFDRRKLLSTFADKVAARQFVASKLGAQLLPHLYLVTSDVAAIDFDKLPRKFVVKASHGSGWIRLVTDKALVHPEELTEICSRWLNSNYYDVLRERAYRTIPPRIMIEEFLDDGSGNAPSDYKFFVFGGRVRLIQIVGNRFTSFHRQSYYDPSWQDTGLQIDVERFELPVPKPKNLEQMLRIAQVLGRDMDFVRVDLYDLGSRVCFGELTSTPGCGLSPFQPRSMDRHLGKMWKSAMTQTGLKSDRQAQPSNAEAR